MKVRIQNKISSNLLYAIAIALIIIWAISIFIYGGGGIMHLLLILAFIAILLRAVQGKKDI
jgi:hypothetical protein